MNTVLKRIVCGFLAFLVLLVSVIIPDFSSFADNVNSLVVSADDNTHYYLYNHFDFSEWSSDDFLTSGNYDNYFNILTGDDKTEIVNKFVDSDYTYTIRALNDFVDPDYTVTQGFNALGLYFLPIQVNGQVIPFEDCKAFIGIFSGSGSGYILLTLYLYYCPNGDDFVYSGDTIYCESPYYLTYQPFVMYQMTYNNVLHCSYSSGSPERIGVTTINSNTGYYQGTANVTQGCIFANFPYLFKYNTSYNSSLDTDFEVFQGYNNNNSLCVDRRTQKFKDSIDPNGGTVSPNDYGFLDGSFDALIYGSSFDDQGFFVSYQLNDVSATIKDQLYLKLNYQFDLDGIFSNNEFDYSDDYFSLNGIYDLYTLQDSSYINVDLNSVFSKMNTTDRTTIGQYQNIYKKFNNSGGGFSASPQTVNPLGAFDILYKNGLLTSAPIAYNIDNPLIQSLGGTYKGFNFQVGVNTSALYNESGVPEISRLDTCLITITISIYNVMTGEESATYLYSYDYKSKTAVESGSLENGGIFGGTYNDGSQASISNPNSSELGYNIANGSQYPVSSGSSSSTGNYVIVQDSPYPYVLVDIPENEWIAKTPNLKTLLETYKDALATTKDESILPLIAQTYNYLPSEAMQYLIYGVGIIVMIGIWRAITRR